MRRAESEVVGGVAVGTGAEEVGEAGTKSHNWLCDTLLRLLMKSKRIRVTHHITESN